MPEEKAGKEVEKIRRTFDECVREIIGMSTKKAVVAAKLPEEEIGKPVETFTRGYGETVAEIRRLNLIKRMTRRKKKY